MGNMNKVLEISGVKVSDIIKKTGTPTIIYDENAIEKQIKEYKKYFRSDKFKTQIVYASKAFTCEALLKMIDGTGLSLDVVSGGELAVAKKVNFPMERVYFHGNNKSFSELESIFDSGVGHIVIDNLMEMEDVISLSEEKRKPVKLLLRINPGIEAHTHEYIMTASPDSKFGINMEREQEIAELISKTYDSDTVRFTGFHSHIGSQIFEPLAFTKAAEALFGFMRRMKDNYGIIASELSLGGGFGIRYTERDKPVSVGEMMKSLVGSCERFAEENGIVPDKIIIEPGRSIVGEAGTCIYSVGYMKKTPHKEYLFVDGGMSDNIRPALYGAEYDCDLANRLGEEKIAEYQIAGKCCESGDILIKKALLPAAREGDLLAVYSCGAYGYSMAGNYNKLAKPAVVFARDGKATLVLRRETEEDMLKFDVKEEIDI